MSFTPVATTDTLETFRTRYNATNITLVDDSSTTVDITLATDSLKLSGGTGITSAISGDTVTHTLNNTSVSAGSFGSATAIPVITVDAQGRITAASTAAASSDLTIVDDSSTATTISLTTDTLKIAVVPVFLLVFLAILLLLLKQVVSHIVHNLYILLRQTKLHLQALMTLQIHWRIRQVTEMYI